MSRPMWTGPSSRELLSVVVPLYNEEQNLRPFHESLSKTLDQLDLECEVIYVNDGSGDGSLALLQGIREADPRVAIVDLSRNFGKEMALTAGLDHARGDAVVMIDADLQHPPEVIRTFVDEWRNGHDMVYGVRSSRRDESASKRTLTEIFYWLLAKLGPVQVPRNAGDFRLLSRRAIDALNQLREHHRFMKGLYAWIGYPQKEVVFTPAPRAHGRSKWSFLQLWTLSIEAITSFTIVPLKLATYVGLLTAVGAALYGLAIIVQTLIFGVDVAGYPSLMVTVLVLGGVQLMFLGVIGEYLGRIFTESKRRPLYFVKQFHGPIAEEGEHDKRLTEWPARSEAARATRDNAASVA